MPTPFEAGLGGFLGGFADTLANSLLYNQQQHQQELQRQKALAQKQQIEQEAQNKWQQTVKEGSDFYSKLLGGNVPSDQAIVQMSAFDQARGTKFTPLMEGEFKQREQKRAIASDVDLLRKVADPNSGLTPEQAELQLASKGKSGLPLTQIFKDVKQYRQSQPYITDAQGNQTPNPEYVPKYIKRTEPIADSKKNTLVMATGEYDPKTDSWRTDPHGNRIYSPLSKPSPLVVKRKNGTDKTSDAHLQVLNTFSKNYILAQATEMAAKNVHTNNPYYDAEQVAKVHLKAEAQRLNLKSWVDDVLPSGNHADDYWKAVMKSTKGKQPHGDDFVNSITKNRNSGYLTEYDSQLLAFKYLAEYGKWPKGYSPASQIKGGTFTPNQDSGTEESDQSDGSEDQ